MDLGRFKPGAGLPPSRYALRRTSKVPPLQDLWSEARPAYCPTLKIGSVSLCAAGRLVDGSDASAEETAMVTTRPSATPTAVNPYAHNTRDHGQVLGFRQSRANESLSRRRKSSVIG